jgi:hypothetical protein
VLKVVPVPNPQRGPVFTLNVLLSAPAGKIQGKLYSKAMVLLAKAEFEGDWTAGWNLIQWKLPDLENGLYFARFDNPSGARGKSAHLVVLK